MESRKPLSLLEVKQRVIAQDIHADQDTVAESWAMTFLGEDSLSCNIAKMLMACVAKGDFNTRSDLLEDTELRAPNTRLTIADYFSHASRVVVDYSNLNDPNKEAFLAYFPKPQEGNKVIARSATHAVITINGKPTELKGFMLGLTGQLPAFINNPKDFGINIAIGGKGQKNITGKTIEDNGHSGHLYYHSNEQDKLLMAGLEQSAPPSLADFVWRQNPTHSETQNGCDQFGQTHSLTGAADIYTAVGSLYFSDPVYQAKLLELNCVAPNKYDAMHVTVNDQNWDEIINFYKDLNSYKELNKENILAVKKIIQKVPASSAHYSPSAITSYISIDFAMYIKRISILLDDTARQHVSGEKTRLQNAIRDLSSKLLQLQAGNTYITDELNNTFEAIETLSSQLNLDSYKKSVKCIRTLTEKQLSIDPRLTKNHLQFLINKKTDELVVKIEQLQLSIQQIKATYENGNIKLDSSINAYLALNDQCLNDLSNINAKLQRNNDLANSVSISLADSNLSASMISGWEKVKSVEECEEDVKKYNNHLKEIENYNEELINIESKVSNMPSLYSELALKNAINVALEAAKEEAKNATTQMLEGLSKQLEERDINIAALNKKVFDLETANKQLANAYAESTANHIHANQKNTLKTIKTQNSNWASSYLDEMEQARQAESLPAKKLFVQEGIAIAEQAMNNPNENNLEQLNRHALLLNEDSSPHMRRAGIALITIGSLLALGGCILISLATFGALTIVGAPLAAILLPIGIAIAVAGAAMLSSGGLMLFLKHKPASPHSAKGEIEPSVSPVI